MSTYQNFSKEIYWKNVKEGAKDILKRINNEISYDGTYEMKSIILPEITAILLKFNFVVFIYYKEKKCIVSCSNEGELKLMECDPLSMEESVYFEMVEKFGNNPFCKKIISEILNELDFLEKYRKDEDTSLQ